MDNKKSIPQEQTNTNNKTLESKQKEVQQQPVKALPVEKPQIEAKTLEKPTRALNDPRYKSE